MANTVSSLSYANTFGDWMVATNNLVIENNILAKENYIKDSGTLYLSESSQTALQSNGNVIIQKVFSVQGIGSSASIQNNLDVQGQGYFTNVNLSLATTGNANVGKTLEVLGTGNALLVSNNAIIGGNVAISYATITRTLQANNTVNTSYASIYNTLFTDKLQANTSTLTGIAVANSSVFTNYLQANTNVLTSALHANNQISTTSASVTGTTWTNVLQANNSTNTSNANIVWTVSANAVQAHVSVNTSNASVVHTTYTNFLQANTSTNTSNASIVWTLYANNVQANATVNTTTASITGTTFTDKLQANTQANTQTLSVSETAFVNILEANSAVNTTTLSVFSTSHTEVLQANSAANTRTMSVTGVTHTDVLQANSAANTRTMSVTGTTHTNVLQANSAANTRTMSVTGTTHTNVLQANTLANTETMTVTGTTHTDVLQANSAANTRTMSVTGTTHTDLLVANTRINTVNVWSTHTVTANTIRANSDVFTPNVRVSELIDAEDAEARVYNLQVGEGGLSIAGNFTLNGRTVFNSSEFIISQGTPNQTSKFSIFRTANGAANGVASNASIRWNETDNYFDLNDVSDGTYYRIITEQQITGSTTTVSSVLAASATAANTLNNAIQTANTFLKARVDSSDSFANGAFVRANSSYLSQNITAVFANAGFAHANASFAAANNVGPQIEPAHAKANAAFSKANAATSEIKGTTGSISPTDASLTFTSNNGVQIYATGANTLAISTSQDLRTTATPSFSSLTLPGTPLPTSSGGTGSTSAASAFNTLVAAATATPSPTSGYVLATGGSGTFYWTAAGAGGAGTQPGTRITSNRLSYTGDGTTTIYATPTFSQANQVRVYINGVRQLESEYSLNSGTSRVTMTVAPVLNDKILVEVDGYAVYEYFANNIVYGPATGSLSAGTIQSAIDGLESGKMPKSGGTFTGDVVGLTMPTTTSNTSFATTAFVNNLANSSYTFSHSISGNAGTVTNGLYSTGTYANPSWISSISASKLSGGTISSTILGSSSVFIGTTSIPLNRASGGSHTLNGVSIDGNAGTVGSLGINTIHTNAEANKLVRTDSTGNTIIKTIVSSTHDKIAATPVYVMASNSTGTFANVTSYQTSYLRVQYADTAGSAGSAPASDVYTWAKAATKPSYTKAEVGLGSVDNTADSTKSVSYATTAGRAYPRRSDGGDLNFYWSGQSGQPTWLWGGTDGVNMYVYNPSNFSVNYAATAGSAPANGGTSTYVSINYNNDTNSTYQVLWGSGNGVYGTSGITVNPATDSFFAAGNITAYASDMRLKGNIKTIQNALYKVCQISGVTYDWNKNTKELGFIPSLESETGVLAQEIEKIIPDAVSIAPFDRDENGNSKSGENYLTVNYEKIIPLLIEAIKELKAEVETLKGQIK